MLHMTIDLKCMHHSIYNRTVKLLFIFGAFDSFLAGLVWAEIQCMVIVALPKLLNSFKQVIQSLLPEHIYNSYYGNGVPAMFTS